MVLKSNSPIQVDQHYQPREKFVRDGGDIS